MRTRLSNTHETYHVYASQSQKTGHCGNVSFAGRIAYSYAAPIAVIVGDHRALVSDETYSVTTSGHISALRSALSHYDTITIPLRYRPIDVYRYKDNPTIAQSYHNDIVAWFHRQYTDQCDQGKRGLTHNHYRRAAGILQDTVKYCTWFHCKSKLPHALRTWVKTAQAEIDSLITAKDAEISARETRLNSPEHKAKIQADIERRYGALIARLRVELLALDEHNQAILDSWDTEVELDKWRRHETRTIETPQLVTLNVQSYPLAVQKMAGIGSPYSHSKVWSTYGSVRPTSTLPAGDILRLSTDRTRIETSRGAQVLVSSATALWSLIARSYREQATYTPGIKVDYYTVTRIECGNVTIGCHYITYAELYRIAVELDLIKE